MFIFVDNDKSTGTGLPGGLRDAVLTIRDMRTKEDVWNMRI